MSSNIHYTFAQTHCMVHYWSLTITSPDLSRAIGMRTFLDEVPGAQHDSYFASRLHKVTTLHMQLHRHATLLVAA